MARLVRFLLKGTAALACIMLMLWLARSPSDLEWWRAAGLGVMMVVVQRFL